MSVVISTAKNNKKTQKKNKNQQKKKNTQVKRVMGKAMQGGLDAAVSMSPCAAKYYIASVNPFHPSATGACVPSRPTRPSQKVTTKAAFDIVVGTAGVGFCLVTPCLSKNGCYAVYSNSLYTGTTATGTNGTVGISYALNSQAPYTQSELTDSGAAASVQAAAGRIVSIAASITYTGTELNRGGLVRCFADPAHENLNGYSISDLDSRNETEMKRTDERTCWVATNAITAIELEYPDISQAPSVADAILLSSYPFSGGNCLSSNASDLDKGSAVIVLMVTGTAGNTYHVEIVQHAEYVGKLTEGKTSENFADSEGLEKALAALAKIPALKAANPKMPMGKLAKQALVSVGKELGPVALKVGKSMILAALA